jgi:hypothetical protein
VRVYGYLCLPLPRQPRNKNAKAEAPLRFSVTILARANPDRTTPFLYFSAVATSIIESNLPQGGNCRGGRQNARRIKGSLGSR